MDINKLGKAEKCGRRSWRGESFAPKGTKMKNDDDFKQKVRWELMIFKIKRTMAFECLITFDNNERIIIPT